jgi:predicted metalloprotease with PDZ domain
MRFAAKFAALALFVGSTTAQVVTSVPGCPAPTYFGICNPYVPGVFIKADERGAISVISTWHDGPAEKAGICPGDKIVAVNGTVATGSNWDRLVRELVSDSSTPVVLRVQRERGEFELHVPRIRETALAALSGEKFIGAISSSISVPSDYYLHVVPAGVTAGSLRALINFRSVISQHSGFKQIDGMVPQKPQLASDYVTGVGAMYDEERREAMVADVSYPSPAFSAGVYPGDLIMSVQNLPLAKLSPEQLAKALAPADSKPLSLVLLRFRKRFEVRLTPVTYGEALSGIGRKLTRFGAAPLHCPD